MSGREPEELLKIQFRRSLSTYRKNVVFSMRKLLLLLAIALHAGISLSQQVRDASNKTIAYIMWDGVIQNNKYETVGCIRSDGQIQNAASKTMGHLKTDGTVLSAELKTVGYIMPDGRVTNADRKTLGYIKPDGAVQNASFKTLGYALEIDIYRAALYFFFFKFG
jgi:hypothetical protein